MEQLGIKIKFFKVRGFHQLEYDYMDVINKSPTKIVQGYGNLVDFIIPEKLK